MLGKNLPLSQKKVKIIVFPMFFSYKMNKNNENISSSLLLKWKNNESIVKTIKKQ